MKISSSQFKLKAIEEKQALKMLKNGVKGGSTSLIPTPFENHFYMLKNLQKWK